MLRQLFALAMIAAVATAKFEPKDLINKQGSLLYDAAYTLASPTDILEAYYAGTYSDIGSTPFNGDVGASTIFTFTVADKKTGSNKPWKNLFTVTSVAFPPALISDWAGAGNSVLTETYQVTSIDSASGALLGSLNWGGAYAAPASGTIITADFTHVFPVSGATGVYKKAKTVAITYKMDGTRDVRILKTQL